MPAGPSNYVPASMPSGYEQDHTTALWDVTDAPLDSHDAPLFQVGTVQYALDAPLVSLAAASNHLALCLCPREEHLPLHIVLLDLDDPARTTRTTVSVPLSSRSSSRHMARSARIFMDPTATHILLCVDTRTYYWTTSWAQPRLVQRLESVPVTAVAWGPWHPAPPVPLSTLPGPRTWIWTPPILLGTARGDLIETIITAQMGDERPDLLDRWARRAGGTHDPPLERYVHHLFSLSTAQPVTGLDWEWNASHQALITVATSSRLYEFAGSLPESVMEGECMLEPLFAVYRRSPLPHVKTELPAGPGWLVSATPPDRLPQAPQRVLSWLNGAGVYTAQARSLNALEHADLLPFPTDDAPMALGSTALHHVLVYDTKVACLRSLDAQLVYEAPLPLEAGERVLGAAVDPTMGTCWIYTAHTMFELVVTDETRDVWQSLLAKQEFDGALAFCPHESAKRAVLSKKADALLAQGQAMEAAACYASAKAPAMEQVMLALMDARAHDALRYYVRLCLDGMPHDKPVPRLMLATWLLELYMAALSEEEERQDTAAVEALHADVQQLLRRHASALNPHTTYELFLRQGRMDIWLMYAESRHDTRHIVQHWVDAQEWTRALEALSAQSEPELYYEFASVLMRHVPAETVQCWQRCDMLDVKRLVPALLQHHPNVDDEYATDYALLYLAYAIDVQGSRDASAHALRLTRLSSHQRYRPALLAFVENASPEGLDLAFALRVCAAAQCQEACVRLYARMEQYENAVQLALRENNVDLACACADLTSDQDIRRDLWLQCAKHVIEAHPTMQDAMQFLLRTDLLTVEDILPFFPDFCVIDELKEDICDTLEGYVTRIDALKDDMDKTVATAASIQHDIEQLAHRVIEVPASQLCMTCKKPLLQRQLYVFPCRHGFHADCLTSQVTQHLPPRRLRRLLQLQSELHALSAREETAPVAEPSRGKTSSALLGMSLERLRESVRPQAIVDAITTGLQEGMNSTRKAFMLHTGSAETTTMRSKTDAQARQPATWAKMEALRAEMNTIIAGACPTCMLCVQQLTAPFENEDEADNWLV